MQKDLRCGRALSPRSNGFSAGGSSGYSIRRSWQLAPDEFFACDQRLEIAANTWPQHANSEPSAAPVSEADRMLRARRRVEAILLLSREPLSTRKIAQLASLADATQARTLTRQLNELYQRESHAMQIEETAGGNVLMTRAQFAPWLRQFDHVPTELRLGVGALETLTIIAYRQPVVRAYIESVRGSNCDEMLKQLLDRDLIRIAGRSEDLGRPFLYSTTKRFLQIFGLRSLEHLPKKEWVLQADVQFANQTTDDSILQTLVD